MFLQALSVCVNYSHHLSRVVDANRPQLDRWIIVTHESDRATRDLCAKYDMVAHLTPIAFTPGKTFPRGAMINEAFTELTKGDTWVLLMDGDMRLPGNARSVIEDTCKNQRLYYTVAKRLSEGVAIHNQACVEGFFQLFHYSQIHPYPGVSTNAASDDWPFVHAHWPRAEDKFIIDMLPEHVGKIGTDWLGVIPGSINM